MTLRLKINLIVSALTLLFMATVVELQLRNMRDSVREEVEAANRVAAQMLNRTAWLYTSAGVPAMLSFLEGVGRVRSNDITLLDAQGHALYASPPATYKMGRDAPAWFARLISPTPAVMAIDFPDGKLVVSANASRAVLDAWDDAVRLVGLGLALLLALNGCVFWLVGRASRPFGRITAALDEIQGGRFDVRLPPLPGREAASIGAAFNRMVAQLQSHIETERRAIRAERELTDSRELARWVDRQIEQERHMIARELHDEFGQSVTAIRSMALSIAQRAGAVDAQAGEAARLIAAESSRLYDAMHGIIPRLTPLVLDNLGLAGALEDLVERTRRSQPAVAVELDLALGEARLPGDAALAVYRAAQEGITNALRHGRAKSLRLRVEADAGELRLCLVDDGRGLPETGADAGAGAGVDGGDHHGLRWLAERVEGLQGRLRIGPAARAGAPGTKLEVRVPLPEGAP
ncbi:MAG: HAMP domain-containing protein [Burkholderiales bacterium]|nr:HAMP domain-containing protein [Burkholderiales bacterium]